MSEPTDLQMLTQEVAGLRDLFQRRLLEDRDKRRLYEELYELVGNVRQDLGRQFVAPVARDLLLLLDRLATARSNGADPADVLDSVRAEVTEILARRDITPFASENERFDPQYHEATGQAVTSDERDGCVVREIRPGWRIGQSLLRPARVVVGVRSGATGHA
ncbi:nucleotide exchange factor GrpE [Dactylosporangium sp. AC04546]|uniref:nucleotide exchange factor GrpE n=1 Tax=Dactylosporangium sp. AC04546 TaxID=2862460 RepID=UPI001EDE7918|nr:nucleotide exchange factor GrpE [Dactylosporangium sp. AC04546]WVK84242.1 nucleotide exchange factor GrpE [Dactylosporangium sp. AC04546]